MTTDPPIGEGKQLGYRRVLGGYMLGLQGGRLSEVTKRNQDKYKEESSPVAG